MFASPFILAELKLKFVLLVFASTQFKAAHRIQRSLAGTDER